MNLKYEQKQKDVLELERHLEEVSCMSPIVNNQFNLDLPTDIEERTRNVQ